LAVLCPFIDGGEDRRINLSVRPKEVASYESVVILMSVVKPDGRARWLGGGG
jgi:hypothetical protein